MTPVETWDKLNTEIGPSERLQLFSALGFRLPRNHKPTRDGWIQGCLLPPAIAIDKKPSVALNVLTGACKDHGSDFASDLIGTICVSKRCEFSEGVNWAYAELSRPLPRPLKTHNETSGRWEFWNSDCGMCTGTYEYKDYENNVLYCVDRFEGIGEWGGRKAFPPRAPWSNKAGFPENTPKVLYRLPEITEAIEKEEVIFLVEGEKDVKTLESIGLVATCNMGGAGNWIAGYTKQLAGAYVAIVPDNDDSGYDHMRIVIDELTGVAKQLCTVILPDLPYNGDVTDFVSRGGTKEQILDLVNFEELSAIRFHASAATDEWLGNTLSSMANQLCDATYLKMDEEDMAHVCRINQVFVTEARRRLFDKYVNKNCKLKLTRDDILCNM